MAGMNAWVGWGISTLGLYFLNKGSKSAAETSYEPEDLNVNANQTKIGSPIPVVLGRCLIKSPLVIYFGDFRADRYTETYAAHANFNAWPLVFALIAQYIAAPATTTGGGSGTTTKGDGVTVKIAGKDIAVGPLINSLFMWLLSWLINGRNLKTTLQKGFKYFLGYQHLIGWSGEEVKVHTIFLKEKKVWEGNEARKDHADAPYVIRVDDDELFGGPDEQGGFVGEIRLYMGGDATPVDPWMEKQMGAKSVQEELRGMTPTYRPFISAVIPTAYIGKSATIPELWIELSNCPNRLGLGTIGDDANPAEALYEIYVNEDWGLAENPDFIDIDALKEIGATLKKEGAGISVQLNAKTDARTLIDNICEHINAVKYCQPSSGKLTFKLIRDDYDPNLLMRLDTHNCSDISFSRLDWGETISEVSVAYMDRKAQYEQSTIPAVDPANIELNGGVKTTKTYSYTYFTTAENALWAAKRELNSQGYPLATANITGNRQLANIRVGECVVLNWEPYGIKNMILRVTNVEWADFVDGKVTIDAIEDVFALAKTDFGYSGSTEWTPEETYPSGVQAYHFMEMPWELTMDSDTYVSAFAAKPDALTQSWTVWRQRIGSNFESTTSMSNWTAAGRLSYNYGAFTDAEDAVGFEITDLGGIHDLTTGSAVDFTEARRGANLLVIGDELMAYSALQQMPSGHWYIKGIIRGVYDTVPAEHYAEDPVFFIRSGFYTHVTSGPVCRAREEVTESYNITTSTVDHDEEFDGAKVRQVTTKRRAELPSPPGRVRMTAHMQSDVIVAKEITGNLKLTWTARNKRSSFGCVSQNDEKEYWTKEAFAAESGTDYLLRISVGERVKTYYTADAAFNYTWEQRCLDFPANFADETQIELFARNTLLLSYQAQERRFKWKIPRLANGAISEAEGIDLLAEWGISDRVIMPMGPVSKEEQILYTDLPVIVLGSKVMASTANAIICHDGSYLLPSGQVMIVKGQGVYDLYWMQKGFIVESCYTIAAAGGNAYYQWDGTQMNNIRI